MFAAVFFAESERAQGLGLAEVTGDVLGVIEAKAAGAVTINYGLFINTVISFIIVAFVIFLLVKAINRMRKEEEVPAAAPTTKDCPYCLSAVPIKATRCAHCTSDLTLT